MPPNNPMSLAEARAYRKAHDWRRIRPASLQALDALDDEVERLQAEFICLAVKMFANALELRALRDELAALRGPAPEACDDYPGKDDGA